MKRILVVAALMIASVPAHAGKPCEELKGEIAKKLDDKGVKGYTLEIVGKDDAGTQTVVGSCEGGTRKIVYTRK